MRNITNPDSPCQPTARDDSPEALGPEPVRIIPRGSDTELRLRILPSPRGVDLRLFRRSAESRDPDDFHPTAAGLVLLPEELRALAAHLAELARGAS